MIEDPIKPDYLFENEFCYVTGEGKLYQKDNAYFKGHELGNVDKDKLPGSLKKFEKAFSEFKKEAEEIISGLDVQDGESKILDRITDLKEKASEINAVGDFEALLSEIENKKTEMEKVSEAVNVEESDIKTAGEPEVAVSEQQEKQAEAVKSEEKPVEPEPVSDKENTEETKSAVSEEKQDAVIEEKKAEESGEKNEVNEESGEVQQEYGSKRRPGSERRRIGRIGGTREI